MFCKRALKLVALLRKKICNWRHPIHLRHPVTQHVIIMITILKRMIVIVYLLSMLQSAGALPPMLQSAASMRLAAPASWLFWMWQSAVATCLLSCTPSPISVYVRERESECVCDREYACDYGCLACVCVCPLNQHLLENETWPIYMWAMSHA